MAVIGLKGGTGKTTLAVAMARTYARARGENVLLFDADTRHGSLPLRTGVLPVASAHDLAVTGDPGRVEILAGSLGRSPDGVWVLPSGRTAAQSAEMDERVYTGAMNAVYRHFLIMITDCGAGVATPLMQRVVSGTHALVLATTATADGVLTTEGALDWLARNGYADLVRRSIVVLTNVTPKGPGLSLVLPDHELQAGPIRINGAHLDVHHAGGQQVVAPVLFGDASPQRAGLLRPAHPESSGWSEHRPQCRNPACHGAPGASEHQDHVG